MIKAVGDGMLGAESRDLARELYALPSERRLTLTLRDQPRTGQLAGVGSRHVVGMSGIGLVAAGDDERWDLEVAQLLERLERMRGRHLAQGVDDRAEVAVQFHPLAGEAQHGLAPPLFDPLFALDVGEEAVDSALLQAVRQPLPIAQRVRRDLPLVDRPDNDEPGKAVGVT